MWVSHQRKIEKAERLLRLALIFPLVQAAIAISALIFQSLDLTTSVVLVVISMISLLILYFSLRQFEEAAYDTVIKLFPIISIIAAIGGLGISAYLVYSSYSILKEVFYGRVQRSR
ncbi:MAG: hypothetical protein DRJ38_04955 [Thermoprotei archaeon]|nr:MAG: hypothetical protein DRJ38_04955 [Thermoprotei archaeon]